jgi:hypothetical protein
MMFFENMGSRGIISLKTYLIYRNSCSLIVVCCIFQPKTGKSCWYNVGIVPAAVVLWGFGCVTHCIVRDAVQL